MTKMVERMGEEKARIARDRMLQMGPAEGIDFHFGGKIKSTRDAHRLIDLAQKRDAKTGDMVVERLFQEFHEREQDLGDRKLLLKAATDAGLSAEEVGAYLASDEGGAEVDKDAQAARDKGIFGVPHFLIQGEFVLDGAQDPRDFLEVFNEVKGAENQS